MQKSCCPSTQQPQNTQQSTYQSPTEKKRNKIVLVGDQSTGKTCILVRYSRNTFEDETSPTIGSNVFQECVTLDDVEHKIELWDTCGNEKFRRSLLPQFYRRSKCVIIVYAINNRDSFDAVQYWLETVHEVINEQIPIILCAAKSDCQHVVSLREGEQFAKELNLPFISCSSKENENITELFQMAMRLILQTDYTAVTPGIDVNPSRTTRKGGICCFPKSESVPSDNSALIDENNGQ